MLKSVINSNILKTKMKNSIPYGTKVFVRREDNYQTHSYETAYATGKCFVELLNESGKKENVEISQVFKKNPKKQKNEKRIYVLSKVQEDFTREFVS